MHFLAAGCHKVLLITALSILYQEMVCKATNSEQQCIHLDLNCMKNRKVGTGH